MNKVRLLSSTELFQREIYYREELRAYVCCRVSLHRGRFFRLSRKGRPPNCGQNTQLTTRHSLRAPCVPCLAAWAPNLFHSSTWSSFTAPLSDDGFCGTFGFGLPGGLSLRSMPGQMQRQPRASRPSHAARYGSACLRSLECRHAHGRCAQLASLSPAALSRRAWVAWGYNLEAWGCSSGARVCSRGAWDRSLGAQGLPPGSAGLQPGWGCSLGAWGCSTRELIAHLLR